MMEVGAVWFVWFVWRGTVALCALLIVGVSIVSFKRKKKETRKLILYAAESRRYQCRGMRDRVKQVPSIGVRRISITLASRHTIEIGQLRLIWGGRSRFGGKHSLAPALIGSDLSHLSFPWQRAGPGPRTPESACMGTQVTARARFNEGGRVQARRRSTCGSSPRQPSVHPACPQTAKDWQPQLFESNQRTNNSAKVHHILQFWSGTSSPPC